jgi:hypothetical protein
MITVDFTIDRNRVKTLQYATGANGSLKFISKIENLESELVFEPFDVQEISDFIENVCGSLV